MNNDLIRVMIPAFAVGGAVVVSVVEHSRGGAAGGVLAGLLAPAMYIGRNTRF